MYVVGAITEDRARHPWTTWNRVARYLKSNKIRRSQLFDWTKTLEKIAVRVPLRRRTAQGNAHQDTCYQ